MKEPVPRDGVHAMAPRERMPEYIRKYRDAYAIVPDAPLVQREFWFYSYEQFYRQGLDRDADPDEVFGFDPPGNYEIYHVGWCEAEFHPMFEEEVLEDRGRHEVIRDNAGRHLLVFKNRRNGFMPEFLAHPVKDRKTWEEDVKWRMDPDAPGRFDYLGELRDEAVAKAAEGYMIGQRVIGGYMYLRSLLGPTQIMYAFYDMPELIHDCMRSWLALADAVTARHQQFVTYDELYLGEDICYNHGPLCSPDTMKEFLFPYYQQLVASVKSRQIDRSRHLYVQVDTDAIGMDAMSPFEVASGCDVVAIGRRWPKLAIFGGIDKRVLAKDKNAIDEMVDRIVPTMRRRGGYIPNCDHIVPVEVPLENYLHYRRRIVELGR
jgi:hypothetical protein